MKIKPNYIIIPAIALFTDITGSMFITPGLEWYKTINIPSWTPPGYVIGVVWITIFILTSISAILVWNNFDRDQEFKIIITLFSLNVCFNILWSYLFFSRQLILPALVEMVILLATVIGLIVLILPRLKSAAYLLFPYAIWLSFATFLTFNIYNLNL